KRDGADAYAAGQPLAWIDDQFAAPADHDWAAARVAAGLPTLLVPTDSYVGLQPEHAEAVRRGALAPPPPPPPPNPRSPLHDPAWETGALVEASPQPHVTHRTPPRDVVRARPDPHP